MSTPKHTPGPYHKRRYIAPPYHGGGVEITSDDDRGVAFVYGMTDSECIANANLFIAAPRMKAAIELAIAVADTVGHYDITSVLDELRAALAEANGEENK